MVGDYYRYIAETAQDQKLEQVKSEALKAYTEANGIELPPCNPIKLGLALNFSVFYYEILSSPDRACHLAKQVTRVPANLGPTLTPPTFTSLSTKLVCHCMGCLPFSLSPF